MSPDNLYLLLSLRGTLAVALSAFLSVALSIARRTREPSAMTVPGASDRMMVSFDHQNQ